MKRFDIRPRWGALILCAALLPTPAAAEEILALTGFDRGSLPEDHAATIDGLIAAAFESTAGARCVRDPAGAALTLELEASGRGPWRIRARATPAGAARDFTTGRHAFEDRRSLPGAVDRIVSEVIEKWNQEVPGSRSRPIPLARALSGDDRAVDRYLEGLAAVRAGDVAAAEAAFAAALERDRAFALAAAEMAFLRLTAGDHSGAQEILGASGRLREESALARLAVRGLRLLIERGGDAGAAQPAIETDTGALWGIVLKGLTAQAAGRADLAHETWVRATLQEPGDPRILHWLGVAHMGAGEFDLALEAFTKVIASWPGLLPARVLAAEALARMRDTDAARDQIVEMKKWMADHDVPVTGDRVHPDLMLGSLDLIEGRFEAALRRFEETLAGLGDADAAVTGTLHRTVVQMRRDMITSTDTAQRRREIDAAFEALARYEASLAPREAEARRDELAMLRGLIHARSGDTVEAWKIVSGMSRGEGDGFEATWLAGATMLKEGDMANAIDRFRRAADLQGRTVDAIVTAQVQMGANRLDEARVFLTRAEEGLRRLVEPWPAGGVAGWSSDLLLTNPYFAAMVPVYHYHQARLAYLSGDAAASRVHFNKMLKYYRDPDKRVQAMVKEAIGRGAQPE